MLGGVQRYFDPIPGKSEPVRPAGRHAARRFAAAIAFAMIGCTGCGLPSDAAVLDLVVPDGFQGLCVVLRLDEKSETTRPLRIDITPEGIGGFSSTSTIARLHGVRYQGGQRLDDFDALAGDDVVGYTWISSGADHTDWFYIGTRSGYKSLRGRVHKVGDFEKDFR